MGISEEVLQSIFEPYFTTKALGEGTGMGLAMVHGIVKKYGGEILVESQPGKGSVFSIFLPVTEKNAAHLGYEQSALPPSGTDRILFVDDELPIVGMAELALSSLVTGSPRAPVPLKPWRFFPRNRMILTWSSPT